MTRPQRLYMLFPAMLLGVVSLVAYSAEHEEIGMAGIVIAAVVGFIGWRVKG